MTWGATRKRWKACSTFSFLAKNSGVKSHGYSTLRKRSSIGTRYASEHELGRVELVLDTYPELNGDFVGRVSGTLVSEDGVAAEFEASFVATRQL